MNLEICVTIFASLATISFVRLLIMIHKYKHVALCKALEINGNSVSVKYTYASDKYSGYRSGHTGEVKHTEKHSIGDEFYAFVNRYNSQDLVGYEYIDDLKVAHGVLIWSLASIVLLFIETIERM